MGGKLRVMKGDMVNLKDKDNTRKKGYRPGEKLMVLLPSI
jgi:hypothetical protein